MFTTFVRTFLIVVSLASALAAQEPASLFSDTPAQQFDRIKLSTSLLHEGLQPWHLRATLKIYDDGGVRSKPGVFEEWWVAPGKYRIEISAADYKSTWPAPRDAPEEKLTRTGYLISQYEHELLDPLSGEIGEQDKLRIEPKTIDSSKFSCIFDTPDPKTTMQESWFCFDPGTRDLRVISHDQYETVVRNRLGRFQNRSIPLDLTLMSQGRQLIVGKVEQLSTFDPSTMTEPFTESAQEPAHLESSVVQGALISQEQPVYPDTAKKNDIAGTVILGARIDPEGKVETLLVISSPNPSLSVAAKDAVQKWRYQPFLLDGKATEVDSIVLVHFKLN